MKSKKGSKVYSSIGSAPSIPVLLDLKEGGLSTYDLYPDGRKVYHHVYRKNLPKLIIPVANTYREIEVEYYSSDQENDKLLHLLFSKTMAEK